MRAGVSVMRSTSAPESLAFVACSTSFLFSFRRNSLCRSMASAIATSARFFTVEESRARPRDASLAFFPSSSASSLSDIFRLLQQDEIVAMDDLVVRFVAQHFFDLTRMQPLDALQLLGAVVDQPAGELAPGGIETAHALADAEGPVNIFEPRRKQAPS